MKGPPENYCFSLVLRFCIIMGLDFLSSAFGRQTQLVVTKRFFSEKFRDFYCSISAIQKGFVYFTA